jgi:hypothetical protein
MKEITFTAKVKWRGKSSIQSSNPNAKHPINPKAASCGSQKRGMLSRRMKWLSEQQKALKGKRRNIAKETGEAKLKMRRQLSK